MAPYIIIFDGICNLCNGFVRFVIKQDKDAKFKFCSLQSEKAKKILSDYDINSEDLKSVVLIVDQKIYTKSDAALKIGQLLGGVWWVSGIFFIVPKFIRDVIYNFLAQNRYRWFGKSATCVLPTEEIKSRFLID